MSSRSGVQLPVKVDGSEVYFIAKEPEWKGHSKRKALTLCNSHMMVSSLFQEQLSGPLRGASIRVAIIQYSKKWCNSLPSSTVSQQMHQKNVTTDRSSCCLEMPHLTPYSAKCAVLLPALSKRCHRKAVWKVRPFLKIGWIWRVFMYLTPWMLSTGISFCIPLGSGMVAFPTQESNSAQRKSSGWDSLTANHALGCRLSFITFI